MKKFLLSLMVFVMSAGCTSNSNWTVHQHDEWGVQLQAPRDWTVTTASNEWQVWAFDEAEETLVKIAITLQSDTTLDQLEPELGVTEQARTTHHGHDVLITHGKLMSAFQSYHYQWEDDVLSITAYLHSDSSELLETVTAVQESVQPTSS